MSVCVCAKCKKPWEMSSSPAICPLCNQVSFAIAIPEVSATTKKRGSGAEHRAKISTAMKKRWQDPEYQAKISAAIKKLQIYANESPIMIDTAKILGAEFERIVEKAAKDLWAYIEALKKPNHHKTIDYNLYLTGLDQSFSRVLISALKVESDLLNTSRLGTK